MENPLLQKLATTQTAQFSAGSPPIKTLGAHSRRLDSNQYMSFGRPHDESLQLDSDLQIVRNGLPATENIHGHLLLTSPMQSQNSNQRTELRLSKWVTPGKIGKNLSFGRIMTSQISNSADISREELNNCDVPDENLAHNMHNLTHIPKNLPRLKNSLGLSLSSCDQKQQAVYKARPPKTLRLVQAPSFKANLGEDHSLPAQPVGDQGLDQDGSPSNKTLSPSRRSPDGDGSFAKISRHSTIKFTPIPADGSSPEDHVSRGRGKIPQRYSSRIVARHETKIDHTEPMPSWARQTVDLSPVGEQCRPRVASSNRPLMSYKTITSGIAQHDKGSNLEFDRYRDFPQHGRMVVEFSNLGCRAKGSLITLEQNPENVPSFNIINTGPVSNQDCQNSQSNLVRFTGPLTITDGVTIQREGPNYSSRFSRWDRHQTNQFTESQVQSQSRQPLDTIPNLEALLTPYILP